MSFNHDWSQGHVTSVKVKLSRSFFQIVIFQSSIKKTRPPSPIKHSESHLIKVKVMWPRSRSLECSCPRPNDIIQGQISSYLDHITQTIRKQSNKYCPCLLIKSTLPLFFHIFLLYIHAYYLPKVLKMSFKSHWVYFFPNLTKKLPTLVF